MCLGCPDRDLLIIIINNLKIRHSAFENSRFDLTESISHFIFGIVIKADTCSLAEAAPPDPQDNVALKRALLSLRIWALWKQALGYPFHNRKNISACLRRCFYNLNTEQVSAAGQAKTQPTRSVTILIAGKVLYSKVMFCCTLHPRDLY